MRNKELCDFADDTTPHACDTNLDKLLMCIEHVTAVTICWFENNYMKLNTDKCHFIISGNKHASLWTGTGNDLWESEM